MAARVMTPVAEELLGLPEPHVLFGGLADRRGSFFLDSGLAMEGLGAFSILGWEPFLEYRSRGTEVHLCQNGARRVERADPLVALREIFARHRAAPHPFLPFTAGGVGCFSYEFGARWEGVSVAGPAQRGEPDWDVEIGFFDGVLLFDHSTRRWWASAAPVGNRPVAETLASLRNEAERAAREPPHSRDFSRAHARPCDSRNRYVASVERIRDYIRSGDVYQVNLAHRFQASISGDPYGLYLRLRERSPAPFASFLNLSDRQVVSCSPERFLRLHGGRVETRPIKGTRPRGRNPGEDAERARELIGSEKERAELLMIVDLERNDLGRVCVPGSIRVDELYRLEAHPTVFHLVATVTGQLRAGLDVLHLLRAAFPGGSITGAPKTRAMQIIQELETAPRGLYTGTIGYLGFDGNADLNIAIRTILCRPGQAQFHVGSGIVWDSDPGAEYEETLAKARALREALSGP